MPSSTISFKGRITLPKAIRDRLGVDTGDRVAFRELPDGTVVVVAETLDLLDLAGSVRPRAKGVTVEAMKAAVRKRPTMEISSLARGPRSKAAETSPTTSSGRRREPPGARRSPPSTGTS